MSVVGHLLFAAGFLLLVTSAFGSWINTQKAGGAYEVVLAGKPLADNAEEIEASSSRIVEDFYNEAYGNTRFSLLALLCFVLSWAIRNFGV